MGRRVRVSRCYQLNFLDPIDRRQVQPPPGQT
jgi:hypothetical protein